MIDEEDRIAFIKDLDSLSRQIQKIDSRLRYTTGLLETCKYQLSKLQKQVYNTRISEATSV